MRRISAGLVASRRGLAACLVAAAAAGCGTVSQSGTPAAGTAAPTGAARPATPATGAPAGTTGAPAGTTGTSAAGTPSGCQNRAPAAGTLTITLAGNQKTYCLRVGDRLRVYLRSTDSSQWLRPLANSTVLAPAPDPAGMLARGVTGAAFTAVRPGQALVTSVRPPCHVAIPLGKGGLEPSDPLPRAYPLQFCSPAHRFSAWLIVLG
jgi:hypothetical protein